MKNFIYKTLFVSLVVLILFHMTFGTKIRQIEENLTNFKSKENINFLKNKIRKEMKSAVKKDKVLDDEDAKLIKQFIDKINSEINSQ